MSRSCGSAGAPRPDAPKSVRATILRPSCVLRPVSSNKKRLLHPGADTKDILTQYVSIIRCLRMVDPPGVLLFKVADPIRQYLRYEFRHFLRTQDLDAMLLDPDQIPFAV